MSHSTTPTHGAGSPAVFTVDWSLLRRRLRRFGEQLFTSARHRAATTEYIPPTWLGGLRLTWFRFGLIALVVFVLTQKQIDFTFSVGADGVGLANTPVTEQSGSHTNTLSILPATTGKGGTPPAVEAPAWSVDRFNKATVDAYVDRFARVARTEEEKYSIPAAAKLAMAILESDAGRSAAARDRNNHFPASNGNRYYDNAWSSWRAHSEDLDRRFPELAHESVNHQQWIAALGKSGYSRDPQYTGKLLQIIDRFSLDR